MIRLTVSLLFITTLSVAQDGKYSLGARSASMGDAVITSDDPWSAFNNMGGMGAVDETAAFLSYQNRYAIKSFQVIGGGMVYQTGVGNAGIKYFKFGDDLFSQQVIGLGLGNQIQMVSLGIGLNVIQTAAEGQRTDRFFAVEFGGRVEITPNLLVGAHIFNFKNTRQHPTTMKAGVSFLPLDVLKCNLELEKQLSTPKRLKFGLEYELISTLFFRTGIILQQPLTNDYNVRPSFGLGFNPGVFVFDYAFISNSELGAIHEISLLYRFHKNKDK